MALNTDKVSINRVIYTGYLNMQRWRGKSPTLTWNEMGNIVNPQKAEGGARGEEGREWREGGVIFKLASKQMIAPGVRTIDIQ